MRKFSFICQACKGNAAVIDVRPNGAGGEFSVRRRYACDDEECGERWTTVERRESPHAGPESALDRLTAAEKKHLSKLVANKLQWIAHKLRTGKL